VLEIQDCCLAVIDVQGKLAQLVVDKEALFKNIRILIQAAQILHIPVLWCQQVPEALGPTVPEIAELLTGTRVEGVSPSNREKDARQSGMGFQPMNHRQDADATKSRGQDARDTRVGGPVGPIDKATFSCCGQERFSAELNALGKEQILLCGIETHVCIYQTAMDLMEGGLDVTVLADAVSSRTAQNRQVALTRLAAEGAHISSTEMALFELLKTAKHPQFKDIAKLIK
jgi:nicotinamidase-related amidase